MNTSDKLYFWDNVFCFRNLPNDYPNSCGWLVKRGGYKVEIRYADKYDKSVALPEKQPDAEITLVCTVEYADAVVSVKRYHPASSVSPDTIREDIANIILKYIRENTEVEQWASEIAFEYCA
jgi:hypothetical protein